MKKLKYLMMVAVYVLFASCMGDSYVEPAETGSAPYGNNELTKTNAVSIAQLKSKFANYITAGCRDGVNYAKVTDDVRIRVIVTSSDVTGSTYQELALQGVTGATIVSVAQGGLCGALPIGTEVLVSLRDLYVSNYDKQAQVGVLPVDASGATTIDRISRTVRDQHCKILFSGNEVEPIEFASGTNTTTQDLNTDGGKLGIIRNVSFKSNDSSKVTDIFADANGGADSVSWTLGEQDSRKVIMYNSDFAKFASSKVPTGKVDIIGIFKRFNSQWETVIRSLDGIKTAERVGPFKGLPGKGDGTQADPLDIIRASICAKLNREDVNTYYIKGIVSQIDEASTRYDNACYYLSNDDTSTERLQVLRRLYLNGDKFIDSPQISVGKKVIILGISDFHEATSIPQVSRNSKIISIN